MALWNLGLTAVFDGQLGPLMRTAVQLAEEERENSEVTIITLLKIPLRNEAFQNKVFEKVV